MKVSEMQDDYNWRSAMEVSKAPYAVEGYAGSVTFAGWEDISNVVASDEGENDGAAWIALFRLKDGRFLWLSASCDYTGWDCQAGGLMQIGDTVDRMVRFAMGTEDRRRLGYSEPNHISLSAGTPATPESIRGLFKCPKCGATPQKHGKGKCLAGEGRECDGLICECDPIDDPSTDTETHGESFADKCTNANCYHCGWGGTVPAKPKGAQAWEKKALDAGWTPPPDRAKELGL